jgi:lambda family phage portal protein
MSKRMFAAASPNVVKDWISESKEINQDLREQGTALRARARDLEQNNDYAAKYLQLVEVNMIGEQGIRLQAKARTSKKKLDQRTNRIIESAWMQWGRPRQCSADGRLSWHDIQRLVVRSVARDGEVLIRLINSDGLKLMVYEADYLDHALNRDRTETENRIVQGIEVDRQAKPVAYHLSKSHPGDHPGGIFQNPRVEYDRVPADEIIHIFRTDRAGQMRGASWLAPAMIHLLMLNRYERAEMIAAEFSAKKIGYYKTPTGDWLEDDKNDYGLPNDIGGLGMTELPVGVEMGMIDPQHPVSAFADYVSAVLKGIATGLGVSYHALSGDLTQVNFSSIRSGTIEERDRWRQQQSFFVEHLHRRVFEAWLSANITNLGYAATDFKRLTNVNWQPRGWTWVDPVKDMQAHQLAYQMGITSLTDIAATQGRDLEDVYDQLQKEKELAAQYGLQPITEKEDTPDDED